jgi:phosphohistidine phosphatase
LKTLLLLRHAKSSRDDPALRDFDRPLNDRGKDDAKRMGFFLRRQNIAVDIIVSSPAKRARRTTEIFLNAVKMPNTATFDQRIYEAGPTQLLLVVSEIQGAHKVALLIGHNPGFEELLEYFTGRLVRMPTAALACIDLKVDDWPNIQPQAGELHWLQTPKELKSS